MVVKFRILNPRHLHLPHHLLQYQHLQNLKQMKPHLITLTQVEAKFRIQNPRHLQPLLQYHRLLNLQKIKPTEAKFRIQSPHHLNLLHLLLLKNHRLPNLQGMKLQLAPLTQMKVTSPVLMKTLPVIPLN
jgi:hypothetical protein